MSAPRVAAPARATQRCAHRRRLGGCGAGGEPRHRLRGRRVAHSSHPSLLGRATLLPFCRRAAGGTRRRLHRRANREVPAIAAALARRGAGGFVCFAAGFSETATDEGNRLTRELLVSAGELPFFGPNCYGFINFFDGAALWPDQVVGKRRERGVALICQSGTLALNCCTTTARSPLAARSPWQPDAPRGGGSAGAHVRR